MKKTFKVLLAEQHRNTRHDAIDELNAARNRFLELHMVPDNIWDSVISSIINLKQREPKYTPKEIVTETYHLFTVMGKATKPLPFLTNHQMKDMDEIGCSEKLNGKKMSREEYLNSLGTGKYLVEQTQYDLGDFEEAFTIICTYLKK